MGVAPSGDASLFIFGTLLDDALRRAVIGREVETVPAHLPNARVALVREGHLPLLQAATATSAEGLLLTGLEEEDLARLDFYEAIYDYWLDPVWVQLDGDLRIETQVYRPPESAYDASDALWTLAGWQAGLGPVIRRAAVEIMRMRDQFSPQEVAARMSPIRTRAQAWVNAQTPKPRSDFRTTLADRDVELVSQSIAYSNFFSFEDLSLKHRKFDGAMSNQMERGVLMSADAVTVLPYDPVRDCVLVIEQFRTAMFMRGDPHPWGLEAIAGRLDPGETPEGTAHREAAEEAGLTLGDLHFVGSYYSAPGSNTEYLYSYIAECDLPDSAAGLGGLLTENEDIKAQIVSFERLDAAIAAHQIDIGPLLLSALWLKAERARLRAAHGL